MVNPPSPTPQHQEMVLPMELHPRLRLILLLTKTSLIRPHIRHHSQAFRVLIPLLQGVIRLPKGVILLPQDLVGIPLLRTLLLHLGTEVPPPDMERILDQILLGKEALGEGCSQAKVFWERQ